MDKEVEEMQQHILGFAINLMIIDYVLVRKDISN
jgi:hypothetical protein